MDPTNEIPVISSSTGRRSRRGLIALAVLLLTLATAAGVVAGSNDSSSAPRSQSSADTTSPDTTQPDGSGDTQDHVTTPTAKPKPKPPVADKASVAPSSIDFGLDTDDVAVTIHNDCAGIVQFSSDTVSPSGITTVHLSPAAAPLGACETVPATLHLDRAAMPEGAFRNPITLTIGSAKFSVAVKGVVNHAPAITNVTNTVIAVVGTTCPAGDIAASIADSNPFDAALHTTIVDRNGQPGGEESIPMQRRADGRLQARYGPYPDGSKVTYFIEAVDNLGATARTARATAC